MIKNMKLASANQIKEIDFLSTSRYQIPSKIRMEIAGLKSFEIIKKEYKPKNSLLVIGTGNNGGDGLVIARHLHIDGFKCEILIVNSSKKKSLGYLENLKIVKKLNIKIVKNYKSINLKRFDLVIDGIFGVGLNRNINKATSYLIDKINSIKIPVCSIDLPSGLNADTGLTYGTCINADLTITFDFIKPGLLTDPGYKHSKKVHLVKLSTPNELSNKLNSFFVDDNFFKGFLKKRDKSSNKGSFGHVLFIGGSKNMSGAISLAGLAAYKSGCGLVTLCIPKCISSTLKKKFPESIFIEIPNSNDGSTMNEELFSVEVKKRLSKEPSAVVIGPGMGNRSGLLRIVKDSIGLFNCPIILDADGLNVISRNLNILKKTKKNIVITPHPGEMSRLSGINIRDVQKNRISIAKEISSMTNAITVLKGYRTIISSPKNKIYINGSGNEGMATGGMGDCLTGIIASFIAQGYSIIDSTVLGVFVHGKAGDIISVKNSKRGILASEIIKLLPKTISTIEENSNTNMELDTILNA